MTAKQFFKSNVFKCLVTLLCILLVCGVFLTVAYAFLKVTDAERLNRAISKIYGRTVSVTALDVANDDATQGKATVLEAYEDEDGNYLIKSKGSGGFGGTVTCWVLVYLDDGKVSSVNKVVVESSDGETFLNKINYLDKFANTSYTEDFEYSADNGFVTSGATLSSTAINNSVNGAVAYVRYVILGETFFDPYASLEYRDIINMNTTDWTVDGDSVTYTVATAGYGAAGAFTLEIVVGADKTISSFKVTEYGSKDGSAYGFLTAEEYNAIVDKNIAYFIGKDLSYFTGLFGEGMAYKDGAFVETGATNSSYNCAYAAAFALANYDVCKDTTKAELNETTEGNENE